MNEFEIIERFFKNLTAGDPRVTCGIGDDAAVIDIPEGYELVVSVDTLVSGIHFVPDVDPRALGFKALAVNLSDLAAMGAEQGWATLSLTMPKNNETWIEKFAAGFSELADRFSVTLIGGDLTHGPLSVTVQVMGIIETGTAIMRSGARVDDDIYVSGYPGEAGYALSKQMDAISGSSATGGHCLERLLKPFPRIELGRKIRGIASACIDISDGLAADLGHILTNSSVGAVIELDRIPIREPLASLGIQSDLWDIVLCSGDDYELCFTVPGNLRSKIEDISSDVDFPVTRIGRIVASEGLRCILADGNEHHLERRGYEHF